MVYLHTKDEDIYTLFNIVVLIRQGALILNNIGCA